MPMFNRGRAAVVLFLVAMCVRVPSAVAQQCVTTLPPKDAVVLFDGKTSSGWVTGKGEPSPWKIADGEMITSGTDIMTRQEFSDYQLHIEFRVPPPPASNPKSRANSGVYLHGHYELQVLARMDHLSKTGCGAIYEQAAPMLDANLPANAWQSFDVFFHAPRLDAKGGIVQKARISVLHNGLWIHHDREIDKTPGDLESPVKGTGPLLLQYHGYAVGYRNIWIRPLASGAATTAPAK